MGSERIAFVYGRNFQTQSDNEAITISVELYVMASPMLHITTTGSYQVCAACSTMSCCITTAIQAAIMVWYSVYFFKYAPIYQLHLITADFTPW